MKIYSGKNSNIDAIKLRKEVNHNLIQTSLSTEEVAKQLGITTARLKIRIEEGIDFPPHLSLSGSYIRHFPREWLEDWIKNRSSKHLLRK